MGSGFHATNPQAAVYWNPANTASGTYTLKGTFTLMKPSGHNNYYGLVFGGSGLEGPAQSYLYFVIAQNGTWLIKRRDGEATSNVAPKTPNDAVVKPGADGKSTNALESVSAPTRSISSSVAPLLRKETALANRWHLASRPSPAQDKPTLGV
jgi:hypothetical protein